jgi:hypothetical protein
MMKLIYYMTVIYYMLMFIYRIIALMMFILSPCISWAASRANGVGAVAGNLIEPVQVASNFIGTASIAIGIACLLASFLKYMQHRQSPLFVPISTPIVLFVIGLILVALPFAYMITSSGVPYGLSKIPRNP